MYWTPELDLSSTSFSALQQIGLFSKSQVVSVVSVGAVFCSSFDSVSQQQLYDVHFTLI